MPDGNCLDCNRALDIRRINTRFMGTGALMTYLGGARSALKMAHECEAAALTGDRKHADYWLAEAKRHRERAAWYISRRTPTIYPIEEATHEHAL